MNMVSIAANFYEVYFVSFRYFHANFILSREKSVHVHAHAVKWRDKWLNEGKAEGIKTITQEMFLDGENVEKIKKYSKLPDKDLIDVLRNLPQEIQTKYSSLGNLNV